MFLDDTHLRKCDVTGQLKNIRKLFFRQASVLSTLPCKLVGWLVGPLVGPLVGHTSDFQSLVSNGRSNQKVKKIKSIYF